MSRTKGYRSYHGRGSIGRIVLIAALCLLLLAAVGFLFLQRYAVYETDGSIHFDLPWRQSEQTADAEQSTGEDTSTTPELVIVPPEEPPRTEPEELHAVELESSVLHSGADAALAALDANTNAVAVRVKNEAGELLYASALESAAAAGAVKGDETSLAAIKTLTESEQYTIARISALHDSIYSRAHIAETAIQQLKHPGNIWYNPESTFYLAPEKEAARAYLADIARECAQLGFDELLFDSFGYPTRGRLNNIDESARTMTKTEALSLLARELRESVAEYDVKLSVVLDAASVLAGGNEKSGQELASLASSFDRIFVQTTAEELPALRAALEPYSAELVPLLTEPPAEGAYLIGR